MQEEDTDRLDDEDGGTIPSKSNLAPNPNDVTMPPDASGGKPAHPPAHSNAIAPPKDTRGSEDICVRPSIRSDGISLESIRQDRLRILAGLKSRRIGMKLRPPSKIERHCPVDQRMGIASLPVRADAFDRQIDKELADLLKELPPKGSA
ncbi:hypothetical protein HH303_08310 [Rhodospirillaceae bacterium KN72]|uniref:Uncharacterized protein n=1 Tax=Pacificispira spongiicola TaxID=2729598 RepID=A0A7Y0DZI4_9PROT|nr:hypothetical protein [Pacificispira spongiicola]NMM44479.1 hypothetical protein [Pacificispira spongiicola]